MFVGIPTLNRYDLLHECLRSLARSDLRPEQVCIVDNGGGWTRRTDWPFPFWVITPDRNLGVAASWNLLIRISGDRDVCLLNDDVVLGRDTLGRMQRCAAPFVAVSDTPGFEARRLDPEVRVSDWSCFLQRRQVRHTVGEYDERFWPGGYEDCDYWRRMTLEGMKVTRLPQAGMTHRVSSTLEKFTPAERAILDESTATNHEYYVAKWGGPPGRESFTTPFDSRVFQSADDRETALAHVREP